MLFLGVSFSFLVYSASSAALSAQQPLAQAEQIVSFENCKVKFFQALYSTVDTLLISSLFTDFKNQIEAGCRNHARLHQLLQQLPFEPDNLRTGDCTFHACCNALMLDEYRHTANSDLLEILGHVAVLTYFRHSASFFSDVFKVALETCRSKLGGQLTKPIGEYYQEFSSNESPAFSEYRKNILERMVSYINGQKIGVGTSTVGSLKILIATCFDEKQAGKLEITKAGSVKMVSALDEHGNNPKIVYKKAIARAKGPEELQDFSGDGGIQCLTRYVQQKLGRVVKVTRQFVAHVDPGGNELGKVFLYLQGKKQHIADVTYTLSPNSVSVMSSPPVPQRDDQAPELYEPALVLQVPTSRIDDPIDEYLTDIESIVHNVHVLPDFIVPERATRHAMVTNFVVAATQNTWFSGKRGLSFLPQTPASTGEDPISDEVSVAMTAQKNPEIRHWVAVTLANFEMYYRLSRKN